MTKPSEALGDTLKFVALAPGFPTSVLASQIPKNNWRMPLIHIALIGSALWNLGTTLVAEAVALVAAAIFALKGSTVDRDHMLNITVKLLENTGYSWAAIIYPTILKEKIT